MASAATLGILFSLPIQIMAWRSSGSSNRELINNLMGRYSLNLKTSGLCFCSPVELLMNHVHHCLICII